MLRGKKVLLGVTASIAAYKTAHLTRLLVKEGALVRVVITPSTRDFVTPLTLSTLSQNPVLFDYFKGETGEWNSHVELAEWADVMLIAPLSANTMAKMVQGICDNLLLAVYLSARCPVVFAPAMDLEMYRQGVVQENIAKLQSMGHLLIPAQSGELASGLSGEGRMEEPEQIVAVLRNMEDRAVKFKGKRFLVSAGPTREAIDPVRFISNHSSGKMGFAIANELVTMGADVVLVHGPVNLTPPKGVSAHTIESADEMYDACMKYFAECDVIVMSAAVADYKPVNPSEKKIKKKADEMTIELHKNKDILKEMGALKKKGQFLVGFALETDNEEANARKKLKEKNLDLMVLNSLKVEGAGFNHNTNQVTFIGKDGQSREIPLMSKTSVAIELLNEIAKYT
ncbi:MAG: bifunctional phosphopantothenoylcysteine decarboxylase/phosphopantothenate--cysteine ligase CoaBC [Vicingaceae bacterium]